MLITVTDFEVDDDTLADGDDYTVRFVVQGGDFVDSDGVQRPQGSTQDFPASCVSGRLTADPFPVAVTTDAIVNQRSSYRVLLLKAGRPVKAGGLSEVLADAVVVPWTILAGYTWAELKLFAGAQSPWRDSAVYTKTEVIREIDIRVEALGYPPDASAADKGLTKLSVAPAAAANPVAVGTNDPRVNQSVSVAMLATAGSGTEGDPYTGWDAAIGTWASNTTYLLNAGKWFAYSANAVVLDTTRTYIVGAGGPAFLKFNGSGIALTFKSTALGGHYYSGIENIVIVGNPSATEGLYTEACHHMRVVNVSVREVSQKAFHFKFAVLNYYNTLQCSQNGNPMTTVPVNGIYTENRGGGETFQANTLVNTIIEVVSGDGIVLNDAWHNHFVGGTSEGNGGKGIVLTSNTRSNVFTTTDCEANGGVDFDIGGQMNRFEAVASAGLMVIRAGSKKTVVRGGQLNSLTVESGALYSYLENINYNLGGTGAITISDPSTTVWGVFTDLGSGGSGGANVIPTNPINFASTTSGPAWDSTLFNVLNVGGGASIVAQKSAASAGLNFPVNAYYDGAAWRYRATGVAASNVYQQGGEVFFQTAVAGVADAVITWTTSGKFGSDGKLYVNDAGALKSVAFGAADSGGAGRKVLTVAN